MRLLLVHADRFEYEAREKAVKEPEPLDESHKRGALENGLVVFSTVEKNDEQEPEQIATNAASSIEEVLGWLKTKKVMVYPYAHLSTNLASREPAISILKALEEKLTQKGYEVSRSPFGWYKSFTITAKGHPLSELSRTITVDTKSRQASPAVKTEYVIMDQEGKLHSPEDFVFGPHDAEFKSLVEKEALKKGLTGGEPHFLDYARRFGIEWESFADVGQMRFGPESNLIMDLLAEYAGQVIRRIGIPILNVKGTNMFDIAVKPIKEHLQLFGSRAYEVKVDEKPILLNFVPEGLYYWVLNVEYNIIDDLDRPREIGTFQIDVGNAKRFGISYADEKGEKQFPVIIHTAVIGGLERYLFTLLDSAVRLERQGRKPMLPVWVSPTQVRIIPVSQQFVKQGMELLGELEKAGIRADLDDRDDTMQSKVRDAELSWIPYTIVYGEKEIKTKQLSVRSRADSKESKIGLTAFLKRLKGEVEGYPVRPLTYPVLLSQRPGYKRM